MAIERQIPPTYFGSEVIRRLKSPSKIQEAEKVDVWGKRNATPREIEQVIFNAKRK